MICRQDLDPSRDSIYVLRMILCLLLLAVSSIVFSMTPVYAATYNHFNGSTSFLYGLDLPSYNTSVMISKDECVVEARVNIIGSPTDELNPYLDIVLTTDLSWSMTQCIKDGGNKLCDGPAGRYNETLTIGGVAGSTINCRQQSTQSLWLNHSDCDCSGLYPDGFCRSEFSQAAGSYRIHTYKIVPNYTYSLCSADVDRNSVCTDTALFINPSQPTAYVDSAWHNRTCPPGYVQNILSPPTTQFAFYTAQRGFPINGSDTNVGLNTWMNLTLNRTCISPYVQVTGATAWGNCTLEPGNTSSVCTLINKVAQPGIRNLDCVYVRDRDDCEDLGKVFTGTTLNTSSGSCSIHNDSCPSGLGQSGIGMQSGLEFIYNNSVCPSPLVVHMTGGSRTMRYINKTYREPACLSWEYSNASAGVGGKVYLSSIWRQSCLAGEDVLRTASNLSSCNIYSETAVCPTGQLLNRTLYGAAFNRSSPCNASYQQEVARFPTTEILRLHSPSCPSNSSMHTVFIGTENSSTYGSITNLNNPGVISCVVGDVGEGFICRNITRLCRVYDFTCRDLSVECCNTQKNCSVPFKECHEKEFGCTRNSFTCCNYQSTCCDQAMQCCLANCSIPLDNYRFTQYKCASPRDNCCVRNETRSCQMQYNSTMTFDQAISLGCPSGSSGSIGVPDPWSGPANSMCQDSLGVGFANLSYFCELVSNRTDTCTNTSCAVIAEKFIKKIDKLFINATINSTDPTQRILPISYGSAVLDSESFSSDKDILYSKIDSYGSRRASNESQTCISCALRAGIDRLREQARPFALRGILLMTDGNANRMLDGSIDISGSLASSEAINIACNESDPLSAVSNGILIYSVGFGSDELRSYGESTLRAISNCTNGRYFESNDTAELEAIYSNISSLFSLSRPTPVINISTPGYNDTDDFLMRGPLATNIIWNDYACGQNANCTSLIDILNRVLENCNRNLSSPDPSCRAVWQVRSQTPGIIDLNTLRIRTISFPRGPRERLVPVGGELLPGTQFTCSGVVPLCGNDEIDPGEECDDGNSDPDDGCDNCEESDPIGGGGCRNITTYLGYEFAPLNFNSYVMPGYAGLSAIDWELTSFDSVSASGSLIYYNKTVDGILWQIKVYNDVKTALVIAPSTAGASADLEFRGTDSFGETVDLCFNYGVRSPPTYPMPTDELTRLMITKGRMVVAFIDDRSTGTIRSVGPYVISAKVWERR